MADTRWAIQIEEGDKISYIAYDPQSGGYPYPTDSPVQAELFRDGMRALQEMNEMLYGRPMKMSDHTISLPTMLRRAGNISNAKREAALTVKLVEIDLTSWTDIKAKVLNEVYIEFSESDEPLVEPTIGIRVVK